MTEIHGDLSRHSRLYKFLKDSRPWQAAHFKSHVLYAKKLGGSHDVYLVDDEKSHRKVILKSYFEKGVRTSKLIGHLDKEYHRLKQAAHIHIPGRWAQVARPIYKSDRGEFFLEEYVSGTQLSDYMKHTFSGGEEKPLYEKLSILAGFLATLHKKTRRDDHVRTSHVKEELERHASQARMAGAMNAGELKYMRHLIDKACAYGFIKDARRSLVHGDATPANFLYDKRRMYVIDMERSGYRDPVYDLGMMSGELFHYAMLYGHDPYKADPFIGHLYWIYAGNFKDQFGTFMELTGRNPLYMANSLLRITRISYIDETYKRRLAYHAMECLRSLKKFDI